MLIFLILILQVLSDCCLNCAIFTSDGCSECESPYSLSNFTCVQECGTGYDSILGVCERNIKSLKLISTNFAQFQLYNLSTAGDFRTSNNSTLIEAGNMFPTVDRGYYSDLNSNLIGKSAWVPWTSFSFKLFFRALSGSGKIFQVFNSDNSTYFEVFMQDWLLTCKILVIGQGDQVIQMKSLKNEEDYVSSAAWIVLSVHIKQIDPDTVYMDLETQVGKVWVYLNDFELAINSTSLWVLGDSEKLETVEGFYYNVEVVNAFSFSTIGTAALNLCGYGFFENPADKICYRCSSFCDSRLICVDDTSCSQCYSNQCDNCNGFIFGECSSCINGEIPPFCCPYLCRKCDNLSSCLSCHKGMYNFQRICLNYFPYLTLIQYSFPLLISEFSVSFRSLYSVFRTGGSDKSFFFYENPEKFDPIPSKQRGLYFNGSSSMKNQQSFNPHPIMSMNFVFRPTTNQSSTVFSTGEIFQIVSNGLRFLSKLQTDDKLYNLFESSPVTNDFNVWYSVSYSISYTYPHSTHMFYYNNQLKLTETQTGVFRLITQNTYFGLNNVKFNPNSMNFTGFLYSFTYWNSVVGDFSAVSAPSSCSFSLEKNCVNLCDFSQYFSTSATCEACLEDCSLGCQDNKTCNICFDRLCANCSDFYDSCYLCVNNSKKVGGFCTCFENSIDFITHCEICDNSCARCESLLVNGCLECLQNGFVLVDGVCYSRKPDGIDGSLDGVVDFELYESFSFRGMGSLLFGNSSGDEQDFKDPIPDPFRGYYFYPGVEMVQNDFLLFFKFYFEVWVSFKGDGDLLNHGSLIKSFIYNSDFFFNLTLISGQILSCQYPLSKTWTNLAISLDLSATNISTLSFSLNHDLKIQHSSPKIDFFIDSSKPLTIGGLDSFKGFLSRIKLKSTRSKESPLIESRCINDCEFCNISSICLSLCDFQAPASNCSESCGRGCLNCYSSSKCQRCRAGMFLEDGKCLCPKLFIWSLEENKCIFNCFLKCLDCQTGPFLCSSCGDGLFLIEKLCIECPSGYFNDGEKCFKVNGLNFQLVFNDSEGNLMDVVSGVQGISGENQSFYPDYDERDPYLTDRGYFFNGINSIVTFHHEFYIFTPEFSLELWINPSAENSLIFSKTTETEKEISFQLSLDSRFILLEFLNSEGQLISVNSSVQVPLNTWTILQIMNEKVQIIDYSMTCLINSQNLQKIYHFDHDFLLDSSSFSRFSIGSYLKSPTFAVFKGFFYEIKIYNSYISNFYRCEKCEFCTSTGKCLPSCSIDEFWSINECKSCHPNCKKGCKNAKPSCNLCEDDLCYTCPSLKNCSKCIENAEKVKSKCSCKFSYYYNSSDCVYCSKGYVKNNICFNCEELCLECTENNCLKCKENSSLSKNLCICDLGFMFSLNSSTCVPVELSLNVSTSVSNWIYLDFSEELKKNLTESDLVLKNLKKIPFKLKIYSKTRFVVIPEIKDESSGVLSCPYEIVSKRNGVIRGFSYNLSFTPVEKERETDIERQVRHFSSKLVSYSTYAAASIIMVNPTPASLWSFINSVQMLIYIYMFDIDLDERTSGFLIGLRNYNMFPNFFEFLGFNFGQPHHFPKALKLGYKTNSVMINVGEWISCFVFFICFYFVIFGLYTLLSKGKLRTSKINSFLLEKIKSYKYGFFIRFWIQGYIEFLISCFLAIYSVDLKIVEQALNFYFSLLFGFFIIMTPVVSLFLGFRSKVTKDKQVSRQLALWSSFFSEFKNDSGIGKSQFYTFFFLRRILFISCIFVFRGNPMIQICFAEILMLCVRNIQMFLFILYKRPFDEQSLNYANLFTELILSLIIPTFACFLFEISDEKKVNLGYLLMILINLIVASQITASFFIFLRTLKQKLQMSREKRLRVQIHAAEEEKSQNSEDLRRIHVSPAGSMHLESPGIILNQRHFDEHLFLDSHPFCGPRRSLKSRELSSQESLSRMLDLKSCEERKRTSMN